MSVISQIGTTKSTKLKLQIDDESSAWWKWQRDNSVKLGKNVCDQNGFISYEDGVF